MSKKPGRDYAERDAILRDLGFSSYRAYLASELWSRIRGRQLRLHPKCVVCGGAASQVHHTNYTRETLTGSKYKALKSVCRDCHEELEFDEGVKTTLHGANQRLDSVLQWQASARKDAEKAAAEAREANRERNSARAREAPKPKSEKQLAHEARVASQAEAKDARMAERREIEVAGRIVTDKERGMAWENVNCRPISKRYSRTPASSIKIQPPAP